jgi:hypothetical protein
MSSLLTGIVALFLLFPQQTASPPNPSPPPKAAESWVDRLYRRIWPVGKFKGNLTEVIARNTEKGGTFQGIPLLYLVNLQTGEAVEWLSARGGLEPVVCPGGERLLYRRGAVLFAETLRMHESRVISAAAAQKLEGATVRHLYACSLNDQNQTVLWVESADGSQQLLRLTRTSLERSDFPDDKEIRDQQPAEFGQVLREIHGLRPDGEQVFVINENLILQRASSDTWQRATAVAKHFFGDPVWVGDSDFVFVNATDVEALP